MLIYFDAPYALEVAIVKKILMCIQLIMFHRINSRQITIAGDMIF